MNFKRIEVFINVAKYKNFSKAATITSSSQPSISCDIAKLEKELHVQLFHRTSKEVELTSAGKGFLKYAIDLLNLRDVALNSISSCDNQVSGSLYIASSSTPCSILVPDLFGDFHKMYPYVNFNVTELNSVQIIEDITKFSFEIGIVGKKVHDEKIHCHKLIDDELVVISPISFNFPEEISINTVLNNELIMREENSATRQTFVNILKKNNVNISDLNIAHQVNSLDTTLNFVKAGLGISIVSSQACDDYVSRGLIRKSRIKKMPMYRSLYMIVCSKRTLTPTAKAFFNFCREKY